MLLKFILCLLFSSSFIVLSQTAVFTTSSTWTAPCDVTSVEVKCWGGGGSGGGHTSNTIKGGGGGAGGAYATKIITVVPGTTYTVTVGATKVGTTGAGAQGNPSWFSTVGTVYAEGGAGGAIPNGGAAAGGIGSSASSIGTTVYAGGNGAAGSATIGGAGGGGAGSSGIGGDALTTIAGIGTASNGGDGGAGVISIGGAGNAGVTYGGGGSGAFVNDNTNRLGGNGAAGYVTLTYTTTFASYCSPTFTSAVEPITNVTFAGINNTTSGVIGGTPELETFCSLGSVVVNSSYPISVSGNTNGNRTDYIRVYIDWNIDGDFVDAGESFNIGTIINLPNGTVSNTIVVPITASIGVTRMRVMNKRSSYSASGCEAGAFFGQAEDYILNITTPLPIELTSFKGVKKDRINELTWVTMTELNNDFFTIDRTIDGIDFETIGKVSGSGSSSSINEYSLNDLDVPSEINYYRLKQTDFNGDSKYSDFISIDNRVTSKTISKIINLHGQEVDSHYKGVVIIVYSDNSVLRTVQNL